MRDPAVHISTDLTRLRFLAGPESARWSAGASAAATDAATTPAQSIEAVRGRVAQAAGWLASRVGAGRRLGLICVDIDEALCLWLRCPSRESAALAQAARSETQDWGATLPIGTMQSLRPAPAGAKSGAPFGSRGLFSLLRRGHRFAGARTSTGAPSQRSAPEPSTPDAGDAGVVLAIPDALLRLWLDALDERHIRADRITTLWHLLASAWSAAPPPPPTRPASPSVDPRRRDQGHAHSLNELVAVIAIEPGARAVWAWGRHGDLVVGGQAALPRSSLRTSSSAPADPPSAPPHDAPSMAHPDSALECVGGRISLDWLSWAAHLGATPARLVILGPAPECAALRAAISTRWPIAASALVHTTDDAVEETLRRAGETVESGAESADARRALVRLTTRPTRAMRARYRWTAVAMGFLAIALAALALRVQRSSSDLRRLASEARESVKERIASLDDPALVSARNPELVLESRLKELRSRQGLKLPDPPRPIHGELARILDALGRSEKTRLRQMLLDSRQGSFVQLDVPDRRTGEEIAINLEQLGGALSWRSTRSGSDQSLRFNGVWTTN